MSWVAVEFNGQSNIRVASAGLPSSDESSYGALEVLDKFTESVEYMFQFTNLYNATIYGKQSINGYPFDGYHIGVDYLGTAPDEVGGESYYGYETVTIDEIIFAQGAYVDQNEPIFQLDNDYGDIYVVNLFYGPSQVFSVSYSGPVGWRQWFYFNLGENIFDIISDNFDFNNADYRNYLAGQDFFSSLSGNDVVILPNSVAAAQIWGYKAEGTSTPFSAGSGNDRVTGGIFEDYIYGESGNDNIFGNEGNDYISGGSGSDNLYGGIGDDYLWGDEGNDILYGDLGEDFLLGGGGINTANYSSSPFAVTVLFTDTSRGGYAEGDHLGDIARVIGSIYNDNIESNNLSNRLYGLAGNDNIYDIGYIESDFYDGGEGIDNISFARNTAVSSGLNINLSTGVVFLSNYGVQKTIVSFENVEGSSYDDTIRGTLAANTLNGGAGFDRLIGESGNDVLRGGDWKDSLYGGAGFDRFDFNARSESGPLDSECDVLMGYSSGPAFDGAGSSAGDIIDLLGVDANEMISGNQTFVFNNSKAVGTLRCADFGGITRVLGYTDNIAGADFRIDIQDGITTASQYVTSDFVL